ncbi:oxidoreductase [Mycobacterium kyogaense]|uniref:oxidoreductase n=1 Tax=Mycobacterium kyogaense TaxID=2212479 RepID=UPI000DAEF91E|nr:oxidoreductase [Mycobacterium kyogaense]
MRDRRWNAQSIPDQTGRIAVVTGANSGIGYETAAALARNGAHTVLAVRDAKQGQLAVKKIRLAAPNADVTTQLLDLECLESIRSAAADLRARYPRIDLLVNNAGLVSFARQTTQDGFELHFGVCHLGHFAFTGLLLETLLNTAGSRVVTVSSLGHRLRKATLDFDDLDWTTRPYNWMHAYGSAKLANLLFTYELQRRLAEARNAETIATAAHPGTSKTSLVRGEPLWVKLQNLLFSGLHQDARMGALPTLRAATDPTVAGGQYIGPGGLGQQRGWPELVQSSAASRDTAAQRRLWEVSQKLTDVYYPV